MIIALGAVSFSGENESFNFNQINKNIRMMLKTFDLDQSLLGEATFKVDKSYTDFSKNQFKGEFYTKLKATGWVSSYATELRLVGKLKVKEPTVYSAGYYDFVGKVDIGTETMPMLRRKAGIAFGKMCSNSDQNYGYLEMYRADLCSMYESMQTSADVSQFADQLKTFLNKSSEKSQSFIGYVEQNKELVSDFGSKMELEKTLKEVKAILVFLNGVKIKKVRGHVNLTTNEYNFGHIQLSKLKVNLTDSTLNYKVSVRLNSGADIYRLIKPAIKQKLRALEQASEAGYEHVQAAFQYLNEMITKKVLD